MNFVSKRQLFVSAGASTLSRLHNMPLGRVSAQKTKRFPTYQDLAGWLLLFGEDSDSQIRPASNAAGHHDKVGAPAKEPCIACRLLFHHISLHGSSAQKWRCPTLNPVEIQKV
jgi:hypothetical protein